MFSYNIIILDKKIKHIERMVTMETKENKQEQAKKPNEMVYTTKEMAQALSMTGKQLRRYLRKTDKHNDGIYTRYAWTYKEYQQLLKIVKEMIAKQAKKEETK